MMNGKEINTKILANNEKIKDLLATNFFTLNKEVQALVLENEVIAQQCVEHEYDKNGTCIYCFKSK